MSTRQAVAETKKCKDCLDVFPVDDFYRTKEGYLYPACKPCMADRVKRRRESLPEGPKEYFRASYAKNRDGISLARKQRRKADPIGFRLKLRDYRSRNKEKVLATSKRSRMKNPEYARRMAAVYEARLAAAPGGHSNKQWRQLVVHYQNKCVCCGFQGTHETLTRDHIIPVSKPGTSKYIWNIQPLCFSCNSSKNRNTIDFRPDKSGLFMKPPLCFFRF